ncbi:alpha/beta fold hydrolase [Microbacterium sp. NPDC019599]|uniref:thioesterase II family protein n=1 Tax=Microbacterium sp. NPDC019599 TaxID=3154690 RepID=UPI0033E9E602
MMRALPLTIRRPNPSCRLRLLVLPHAGGSSAISVGWHAALPADVEVVDVDLPARGGRIREPPLASVDEYVERLLLAHADALSDRPLVIYGHSLGAIAGFELSRRLVAGGTPPLQLVVSGRGAPHLPSRHAHVHHLPRADFLRALSELEGTPQAVLDDDELMDLLLPALRADFRISERYEYRPGPTSPVPLLVLAGRADREVLPFEAAEWARHTTAGCTVETLPGGHFFPLTDPVPFLTILARAIRSAGASSEAPGRA